MPGSRLYVAQGARFRSRKQAKSYRYAFVAELLFLDSSQNPPDVVGAGHEVEGFGM